MQARALDSPQSHKYIQVPDMTSPEVPVIISPLCLPAPVCLKDVPFRKDPCGAYQTPFFPFELTSLALV